MLFEGFPRHKLILENALLTAIKLDKLNDGEMSPGVFEEEIEKKKREYHFKLQPFYKQCMKSEVRHHLLFLFS